MATSSIPTSTYQSFLMRDTGTSGSHNWQKVIDITDYPDIGGDPETLETTTLSDAAKTYILGIQDNGALTFNANYSTAGYAALSSLIGTMEKYSIWFGATVSGSTVTPSGNDGKFDFDGQLNVKVTGAGVNEVRKMAITIAPSTVITATMPT